MNGLDQLTESAVQVNQRALIDKILARYSGLFTIWREVLQNASDAGAENAQIHFVPTDDTSLPEAGEVDRLPSLNKIKCKSYIFKNDGQVFRPQDWSRLRTIAEGNPEDKIGQFGVGFYSLWSITEEPTVLSGDLCMHFYYKQDTLFTRHGRIPDHNFSEITTKFGDNDSAGPWTSFHMPLRSPGSIPDPAELVRFLATSLAHAPRLRRISLFLGPHRLADITKSASVPQSIAIPTNIHTKVSGGMMDLASVEATSIQLKAQVMHWVGVTAQKPDIGSVVASSFGNFTSRLFGGISGTSAPIRTVATPSPGRVSTSDAGKSAFSMSTHVLFLRLINANAAVSVRSSYARELERATKKKAPSSVTLHITYSSKDEMEASQSASEKDETFAIFSDLMSDLRKSGRIAIGFRTHQTTGFAGDVACPRFIPTVERESLDLVDQYVSQFNKALLSIAGLLARVVYEDEMSNLDRLFKTLSQASSDIDEKKRCDANGSHVMSFFTFKPSTPSTQVSSQLVTTFFDCDKRQALPVLSSKGVLPAHKVRIPVEDVADFIKDTPVLPETVTKDAAGMIQALVAKGVLKDVQLEDVYKELGDRALSVPEMVSAIKWWFLIASNSASYDSSMRHRFLDVAMVSLEEQSDRTEKIVPLASSKYYLNVKVIPTHMPLPPSTAPFEVTKSLNEQQLRSVFGWAELDLEVWTKFLIEEISERWEQDAVLAEKILSVFVRAWPNLSQSRQDTIAKQLEAVACIPTRVGMSKPSASYFPNVDLFPDLPIVSLENTKGPWEKQLIALGVRKHVELQLVFTRMLSAGEWNHVDLVKYLVSVKDTLTPVELNRLKKTAMLPREGEAAIAPPATSKNPNPTPKIKRYLASELHEPTEALRSLQGLPLLEWSKAKWKPTNAEARFLFDLGLKRHPTPQLLFSLAGPQQLDPSEREMILQYFDSMHHAAGYADTYKVDAIESECVPVKINGQNALARPSQAYTNAACACMGFAIVNTTVPITKLNLPRDPPSEKLVDYLRKSPPRDPRLASPIFSYMASRSADLTGSHYKVLSRLAIVPVQETDATGAMAGFRHHTPSSIFIEESPEDFASFHRQFFTFVNFGPEANRFLRSCGARTEPNVPEIAYQLAQPGQARNYLDQAPSSEDYLSLLRAISAGWDMLSSSTRGGLAKAPIMLAEKVIETSVTGTEEVDTDSYDDLKRVTQLMHAHQVVISDSHSDYLVFRRDLWAVPADDLVELLAERLGAHRLSGLVKEESRTSEATLSSTELTRSMRALIIERTPLFMSTKNKGDVKHELDWLVKSFEVMEAEKITRVRLLQFKDVRRQNVQKTTASILEGRDRLGLYITKNPDFLDIAEVLSKVMLRKQSPHDTLIFSTLLSKSLNDLQRRGYPVDRILTARRAQMALKVQKEQQALKAARLEKEKAMAVESRLDAFAGDAKGERDDNAIPESQSVSSLGDQKYDHNEPAITEAETPIASQEMYAANQSFVKDKSKGLMQRFRDNFTKSSLQEPVTQTPTNTTKHRSNGHSGSSEETSSLGSVQNTKANIARAIAACGAESSNSVANMGGMKEVTEAKEGYCDISPSIALTRIFEIGPIKVYGAEQYLQTLTHQEFADRHSHSAARFANRVLLPLAKVLQINPSAISVFWDRSSLIAFNRRGSLFCNLSFYEAWHDKEVENNQPRNALLSWWTSLNHEIAHNLVEQHGAEHEYYAASLAEFTFVSLAQALDLVR